MIKRRKPHWVYYKEIFRSKFQAGCVKAKLEDNWQNGYEIGPLVEVKNYDPISMWSVTRMMKSCKFVYTLFVAQCFLYSCKQSAKNNFSSLVS